MSLQPVGMQQKPTICAGPAGGPARDFLPDFCADHPGDKLQILGMLPASCRYSRADLPAMLNVETLLA